MSAVNWKTAIDYARLVQIAESVNPQAGYSANNKATIDALGYTFLETLYGNELSTDVDPHAGETVTYGFLAVSKGANGELVAIVRGTDTIEEWVHDACFLMVPNPIHPGAGWTEDGFTDIYRSLRVGRNLDALTAVQSIIAYLHTGSAKAVTISGHSLGGALATLLTLDVALNSECRAPVLYSFASPRVGDHQFAGAFDAAVAKSYRVYNRADLVPNLPPILPLPYEHTQTPCELVPPIGVIEPTIACEHHLTSYLWLMQQQVDPKVDPYPVNLECRGPKYREVDTLETTAASGNGSH
jgi:Lipase (class 3)